MSQFCDLCTEEEYFSSFLAGVLLTRNNISNVEFCELMEQFQEKYNVSIVGENFGLRLMIGTNSISLIENYDDFIVYDDKKITIREYLNIIASDRVIEFFGLVRETKEIKKISSLKKIKKKVI